MAGFGPYPRHGALFAVAIVILWLAAAPSAAIEVRVSGGERPCTLYVYDDGSWSGAADLPVGAPARPILADAARALYASMEAWENRMGDRLLPALGRAEEPADSIAATERDRIIRFLTREMRATVRVDSMAAEIAAHPSGTERESLSVRLWVAREVDDAKAGKRREFDLYAMKSEWVFGSAGWGLGRLWDFAATYWPPEQDAHVATPFPARPPMWMQTVHQEPERPDARAAARWRDITWIEDGTMLPPYPVFGAADPPTTAKGPIPVTAARPNYPEFAREAQIEGTVVIKVLVGSDGRVESMRLVRGVTGLNDAALDGVRKWVFEPAVDETGTPRPAWYEAVVEFKLR